MDKNILVQYCDMKKEIKDIRARIRKLDKFLDNPPIVSDTVQGSRKDGTIGLIKITGIPDPLYTRKLNMRERYWMLLERKEAPGLFVSIVSKISSIVSSGEGTCRSSSTPSVTWTTKSPS